MKNILVLCFASIVVFGGFTFCVVMGAQETNNSQADQGRSITSGTDSGDTIILARGRNDTIHPGRGNDNLTMRRRK